MGSWSEAAIEAAVAIVAIVASGLLLATNHLNSDVFASLTTLCLGYVFGANRSKIVGNGANK